MERGDDITATWDMRMDYLQRIASNLWECANSSKAEKAWEWYKSLLVLRREIMPFLKKAEEKKSITEIFNKIPRIQPGVQMTSEMYQALDAAECEIRNVLHQKKMLIPTSDDPRYAVLG